MGTIFNYIMDEQWMDFIHMGEKWTFMDDVGNDINHDVEDVICDIIFLLKWSVLQITTLSLFGYY